MMGSGTVDDAPDDDGNGDDWIYSQHASIERIVWLQTFNAVELNDM